MTIADDLKGLNHGYAGRHHGRELTGKHSGCLAPAASRRPSFRFAF